MNEATEIDRLVARREHLARNVKKIGKDLAAVNAQLCLARKELAEIDQLIEQEREKEAHKKEHESKRPSVSDHAVIRYLERKHGFSFDDVRAEILTSSRIAAINAGAKAISYDGMRFLVRDKTITTVVDDGY